MSRLPLLRLLIGGMIASTAIHYTHNFVKVKEYPGPHGTIDTVVRVVLVVAWPTLTYFGIRGYRWLAEGRLAEARIALLGYTLLGWGTFGHFVYGNPDVPAIPYVTLFTDGTFAAAITAFVLINIPNPRPVA